MNQSHDNRVIMSKLQLVKELHRDARKNFRTRQFTMRGIGDTLQADLIELPKDKGMKYCLTVIDIFSKMAYARPLKTKTGPEVTKAMQSVLFQSTRSVKNLHVDRGTEFYNTHMTQLLERHQINRYSTFSPKKAAIVERFNRTLKKKIYMQFSLNGNYKWVDILPSLMREYNTTRHRTIKMAPNDVDSDNEQELLSTVYDYKRVIPQKKSYNFKVGDHVRLSKYKHLFEKGYLPSWTTEVFTIVKIQKTDPVTYLLADFEGKPIEGCIYAEEMQATKQPNVYLVEKILRKKNKKVYVKWLGFGKEHNSWINASDVI